MKRALPDSVIVERDGAVATVTISRPEKLNAIDTATARGLSDAFDMLSADDGLRAVVLRGAGEKAFGAGADIGEFAGRRGDPGAAQDYERAWGAGLARCRHPVIAAIQGYCIGGSLGLLPDTDIRIAGAGAIFQIPAARLGIVYGHDDIARLARLTGHANALALLLEAARIPAAEALRIGLVNRVVPDDRLWGEARATAERIAALAPLSARWHKKFARRLLDPAPLSDEERAEAFACFATEDYEAARRAFATGAVPAFKGR